MGCHRFRSKVKAMASNINHDEIHLAPADKPRTAGYWDDFYSWLIEQAAHLRSGRFEALDRENLAEEIESLGREQFNKLESALRVLMMHMLKWDHQPSLRSRSWIMSTPTTRGLDRESPRRRSEAIEGRGSKPPKRPDWKRANSPSNVPIRGMTLSDENLRPEAVFRKVDQKI